MDVNIPRRPLSLLPLLSSPAPSSLPAYRVPLSLFAPFRIVFVGLVSCMYLLFVCFLSGFIFCFPYLLLCLVYLISFLPFVYIFLTVCLCPFVFCIFLPLFYVFALFCVCPFLFIAFLLFFKFVYLNFLFDYIYVCLSVSQSPHFLSLMLLSFASLCPVAHND